MIGVISHPAEQASVEEFFQLFKTPWEPFQEGRPYDVVLVAVEEVPAIESPVLIVFGSQASSIDQSLGVTVRGNRGGNLCKGGDSIPVYGELARIKTKAANNLIQSSEGETAVAIFKNDEQTLIRAGYNLFQ